MEKIYNGFQCDICKAIYKSEKEAEKCENTPAERPLLQIGDIVVDDSFDKESEMRVCKITFSEHEVVYRMEWQLPEDESVWEEVYSIYGNAMLESNFDVKSQVAPES